MKTDAKGYITLTPKESEDIMDLLETLAAMSDAYDDYFTKKCKKAQKYSDKILSLRLIGYASKKHRLVSL